MHPALALSPSSNNFARNRAIAGRELAKRACRVYISAIYGRLSVLPFQKKEEAAQSISGYAGQDRCSLQGGEDRDGWTGPGTLASSDFCFGAPLPHSVAARREPCPEQSAGTLQIFP